MSLQIAQTTSGNFGLKKTWKGKTYLLVLSPAEMEALEGFIYRFRRFNDFK